MPLGFVYQRAHLFRLPIYIYRAAINGVARPIYRAAINEVTLLWERNRKRSAFHRL